MTLLYNILSNHSTAVDGEFSFIQIFRHFSSRLGSSTIGTYNKQFIE